MRDRLVGLALLASGLIAGWVGMWLHDFWWMQLAFGLLTLRICWELWPEPPQKHKGILEYQSPTPHAVLMPTYQPVLDAVERPEVFALYETLEFESPPGYVWVKPKNPSEDAA